MKTLPRAFVPLCLGALVAMDLTAQVRIDPAPRAKAEASKMSLQDAVAKLKVAAEWPVACRSLLALAKDQQQEVLEAIAPLTRPGNDSEVMARSRVVLDALIAQHQVSEKREELRKEFRRVADAVDDLKAALGDGLSDAQRKSLTTLLAHVGTMQKRVDTEEALAPAPLRVPTGNRREPPAADAGKNGPDLSGYRKIEVDGKTMLVPADALPPGTDYEAEMTEKGLVIKKKGKAKDAPKDDGKGGGKDQKDKKDPKDPKDPKGQKGEPVPPVKAGAVKAGGGKPVSNRTGG